MRPEFRGKLAGFSTALGLGLCDAQIDTLLAYLELLNRWNATYNLTGIHDPSDMLVQHLADCLAIVPALRRQLGAPLAGRALDVGSGAGLPGVVLAVLAPEIEVLCVDKVGKKAAFVRQVSAEFGLANLSAAHVRIEALAAGKFGLVVSRAFAALSDFVSLTTPHIADDGVWLAMKGKHPADELEALPAQVEVFHVEPLRVPGLAADRCLVWIRRRQ